MLKKSKLFVIAIAFVAVFAVASVASAADLGSSTLRKGSTGPYVVTLQTLLGVQADGAFGPMTEAAVKAWQASHGLVADGVVGAATKAAMNAGGVTPPPASGCQVGWKVNPITGVSCSTQLPAGCQTGWKVNPITGESCVVGSTPTPGNLTGGAGELMYSSTKTDLKSDVKEGGEEKVLATKLEADGSDIGVNSVKVSFENNSGDGSTRLDKYLDEVIVMLGSTEVGSVDADEFSRDGSKYSKNISLSNAVVQEGEKETLYIAVKALSTVDDEAAEFDGIITQIRWADATGALFSDDSGFGTGATQTFGFDEANEDDSLEVKSSSANPDDVTVKIDAGDSTDDVLALAFKFDVDEDSADVSVTYMEMVVAFENYDTDLDGDVTSEATTDDSAAEAVVEELLMKVNGEEYEFDLESVSILANGTGTAIYSLDLDEGELVIDSDSTEEAKVYLTLADQDNNYNDGLIIEVTVDVDEIQAETENDELSSVSGTDRTGGELTLSLASAVLSGITWTPLEGGAGLELKFKVEAEDDSVDVTLAALQAVDTVTTTGTVGAPTLTKIAGTATDNGGNSWTIEDGDDATFSLVYTNTGANGTNVRVTMPTIAGQNVPDDKEVSPLVTRNVNG